ncbi:NUDIX hydrolase [Streptomyces sp. QH1-20]|uniref:NUDIX hydrolase n=1 Tax=Streptomyces sp. QH1-20 TaxID=3240934 RepID=UPI0035145559
MALPLPYSMGPGHSRAGAFPAAPPPPRSFGCLSRELPSGGVDAGETLIEALRREGAEETGLTVTGVGGYLGHFDYRSGSGRATRQFNFAATVAGETVELTEHDAHLWADRTQQNQVSSAVQTVLDTWRRQIA